MHGMSYSQFMGKVKANGIELNRKVLADLAMNHPDAFKAIVEKVKQSDALWLFGPRSGSKTDELSIPENLAPGPLQKVIPVTVNSVETTHPDYKETVKTHALLANKQSLRFQFSASISDQICPDAY